jgi:hypothetical protein
MDCSSTSSISSSLEIVSCRALGVCDGLLVWITLVYIKAFHLVVAHKVQVTPRITLAMLTEQVLAKFAKEIANSRVEEVKQWLAFLYEEAEKDRLIVK